MGRIYYQFQTMSGKFGIEGQEFKVGGAPAKTYVLNGGEYANVRDFAFWLPKGQDPRKRKEWGSIY